MSYNNGPTIVRDGLVLYYDPASPKSYVSGSTTIYDLSVNGITGSLVNGPAYNSSNGGNIVFDGSDDFGAVSSAQFQSGNNPFSIELWFRPILPGSGTNMIFGYGNDVGPNKAPLILFSGSLVRFEFGSNSGGVNSSVIPSSSWYQATATYNGSSNRIYLNGTLSNTASYSAAAVELSGSNGTTAGIGCLFSQYGNVGTGNTKRYGTFNGNISTIRYYNRALSADEVRQNYNATKGRYPAPAEYLLLKDGFSPATQSWTLGPTFSITDKLYANPSGITTSSFFSFSTPVAGNLWMYCIFNNGAGGGGFGPQNVATLTDSSGNIVAAIGYNRLGGRAFHLMNGITSTVITTVSLDSTNYHLWLNCGTNSNIRGWVSTTSTRPATFAEMARNSYAPMARFYATVPATGDPNWDNIVISTQELGNNPF